MTSVVGYLLRVFLREQVFEVVQLALEHLILGPQSRIIQLQFVILLDDPVVGVLEDIRLGLLLGPRLFGRLSVLRLAHRSDRVQRAVLCRVDEGPGEEICATVTNAIAMVVRDMGCSTAN